MVSVILLNLRIVRLSVKKRFFVLLVRFLRRCLFHVVSLASCFEIAPDLVTSKHVMFVVYKAKNNLKSVYWACQLTSALRRIRNAWHLWFAVNLVI